MRQQGDSAAALDDGAALFRECTAPPLREGPRKGGPNKACLDPILRQQGDSAAALDNGAALFRECTAPPLREGPRKGGPNKACLDPILSACRGWLDIHLCGRSQKHRLTKPDGNHRTLNPSTPTSNNYVGRCKVARGS